MSAPHHMSVMGTDDPAFWLGLPFPVADVRITPGKTSRDGGNPSHANWHAGMETKKHQYQPYPNAHLLGLPAELRNKILTLVVEPEKEPELTSCFSLPSRPGTIGSIHAVLPWSGAAQVNKQMNREVRAFVQKVAERHPKMAVISERFYDENEERHLPQDRVYRWADTTLPPGRIEPKQLAWAGDGTANIVVFELSEDGRLLKTEEYQWPLLRVEAELMYLREVVDRLERRSGWWWRRYEVPMPATHSHITDALGAYLLDWELDPDYHDAMGELELAGWQQMVRYPSGYVVL